MSLPLNYLSAEEAYSAFLAFLESIQNLPLTERLSLLAQMSKDIDLERRDAQ